MARHPDDIDASTLQLLTAAGIGPATVRKLRAGLGSDDAIAAATVAGIASIDGVGRAGAQAIRCALDEADVDAERAAMKRGGARLVLRGDTDYPVLLAATPDGPEALWIQGAAAGPDDLAVAIVGARRATGYGLEQAARLGALLAESGLTIVSGGASGIDGAAHRGAMRAGGRTVAVLGCGLSTWYPSWHTELFERIVDSGGAIVSEHPMGVPPRAGHFPRRNRIISGLSLGVLVIEAAARSGALITARIAAEDHGREVMALPGRVDSPASAGCHRLLRDGAAALVTDHADILRQLDASSQQVRAALEVAGLPRAATRPTFFEGLSPGQSAIVEALTAARAPLAVDQLVARTGRPMSALLADVTLLEIRGVVDRLPGGLRLRGS